MDRRAIRERLQLALRQEASAGSETLWYTTAVVHCSHCVSLGLCWLWLAFVETAGARTPHHVLVTLQPASLRTCSQGRQNGHANETPEPDTCRSISVSLQPELLGSSHSTDMERQGGATRTLQRLETEE